MEEGHSHTDTHSSSEAFSCRTLYSYATQLFSPVDQIIEPFTPLKGAEAWGAREVAAVFSHAVTEAAMRARAAVKDGGSEGAGACKSAQCDVPRVIRVIRIIREGSGLLLGDPRSDPEVPRGNTPE